MPGNSKGTGLQQQGQWAKTWRLVKPYWFSDDWRGRLLLGVIISLTLAQTYITVLINRWNNTFYNALQNKDLPVFMHQIVVFSGLAACYIAVAVYRQYFSQMLQMRWRAWLTRIYQAAWLKDRAYYRLQVLDRARTTDNPDQRIAEDLDIFTSNTLSLVVGGFGSVITLGSFVAILWGLSGTLRFTLLGHAVAIPGYMVWVALVYAIIGTWLTHVIGRKLIGLNFNQQRFEATYRFGLVRLRENAESIAFYRGEGAENEALGRRFTRIIENWWAIMKKQKQLTWFTSGYGQVAIIFPILVAAPRYFAGKMTLGGLMQTSSAFGYVQGAMSWFIDVYPQFATWKAATDRLNTFADAMFEPPAPAAGLQAIERTTAKGAGIAVKDLDIYLPDGTVLVEGFNLTLKPGARVMVAGPSGRGKTTLLRVLAGLWPYGRGAVTMPADGSVMFVPQKPYLPNATLADVVCYPHTAADCKRGDIEAALRKVGMDAAIDRLDVAEAWAQVFSVGEQQRLAFARVLLHKPAVVLLDEATSALDEAGEAALYKLLLKELPKAVVVSVSHHDALAAFHERTVTL